MDCFWSRFSCQCWAFSHLPGREQLVSAGCLVESKTDGLQLTWAQKKFIGRLRVARTVSSCFLERKRTRLALGLDSGPGAVVFILYWIDWRACFLGEHIWLAWLGSPRHVPLSMGRFLAWQSKGVSGGMGKGWFPKGRLEPVKRRRRKGSGQVKITLCPLEADFIWWFSGSSMGSLNLHILES